MNMNTNTNHRDTAELTRPTILSHRRVRSDSLSYDDDEDTFDIKKFKFNVLDITSPDFDDSTSSFFVTPHIRSLSVDAAFFDDLSFTDDDESGEGEGEGECMGHQRAISMDDAEDAMMRAMSLEKLAEFALLNPRRVRRILANRKSAARAKEKKMRYTTELEKEVESLKTESANLETELALLEENCCMMQQQAAWLNAENKELKLRLEAEEEQARLRAALKESLKNDINRLKMEIGLPITSDDFTQFPPEFENLLVVSGYYSNQRPQPQMPNQNQNLNQASPSQMPFNPNFLGFNPGA